VCTSRYKKSQIRPDFALCVVADVLVFATKTNGATSNAATFAVYDVALHLLTFARTDSVRERRCAAVRNAVIARNGLALHASWSPRNPPLPRLLNCGVLEINCLSSF
jgi:hypothetical protein